MNRLYGRLRQLKTDIEFLNRQIDALVKTNPSCQRLTAMEGIGPIGSILLFATLGSGEAFINGRQFSAYLGLTPKQYSSGGKTKLVGISKHVANRRLPRHPCPLHIQRCPDSVGQQHRTISATDPGS